MTNVALVPARCGSTRVKDKNIRDLGGAPLIAHTIAPAIDSGLFDRVVVVTDSVEYANIARSLADISVEMRPPETATKTAPDFLWVSWVHSRLTEQDCHADTYCILRPTSPFRTPRTIQRAYDTFFSSSSIDTLRAVQRVTEHPGKMWVQKAGRIVPLLPFRHDTEYWHNSQSNTLAEIWVQNASLEIMRATNITDYESITGRSIVPFETIGVEGFDINTETDFARAAEIIESLGQ
ncbi:acylneuraminate cytidylyltransferase family protein [Luminiphilus sp.]|nr:acylneuraminate cytidylyltransferase family protein [Luminiphilus sp.]